MSGVMIGIDPHKGSHTAVLDEAEKILGQVRVNARADQAEQLRAVGAGLAGAGLGS